MRTNGQEGSLLETRSCISNLDAGPISCSSVAPCSANTLAKIAHGLCDNLATALMRALAPTIPAMNTLMYEYPLTAEHDVVGYNVIGPIGKNLACVDVGIGGMTEWRDIVQIVVDHFHLCKREQEGSSL